LTGNDSGHRAAGKLCEHILDGRPHFLIKRLLKSQGKGVKRVGSHCCLVKNFPLTPGFGRVRTVREHKKPFKRFFFVAFRVHRV
jgi:hypothetical protein